MSSEVLQTSHPRQGIAARSTPFPVKVASGLLRQPLDAVFLLVLFVHCNAIWIWPADAQTTLLYDKPYGIALTLALGAGCVVSLLRNPGAAFAFIRHDRVLAAFVALISLSFLWSSDKSSTAIAVGSFLAVLIVSVDILDRRGVVYVVDLLVRFSTAFIAISAVLALMAAHIAVMDGQHAGLWRGVFAHKNPFGAFVVFHTLLVVFASGMIGYRRATRWCLLVLSCVTLMMAGSKTALLIAPIAIASTIFVDTLRRMSGDMFRFVAISILIGVFAAMLTAGSRDLVADLVAADATITGRDRIWTFFLRVIEGNGALGTGYGTSYLPPEFVASARDMLYESLRSPHNAFLALALNLGWLGSMLYAAWLAQRLVGGAITVGRSPFGAAHLAFGIAAGLLAMVESSGWSDVTRGDFFYLWMFTLAHRKAVNRVEPRRPMQLQIAQNDGAVR